MYVIAGATGRVGSAAATSLLKSGAEVRVLVRRRADAETWASRGAQPHLLDLADRAGLARSLVGATGFFTLLPFDLAADDLDAHADRMIASITGAVSDAQVGNVVTLSSGGADLAEGTGPITGLHRLEQELLRTGAIMTALRSGHFQEKVLDVVDVVVERGSYPVFAASADDPRPMAATSDIGEVAAQVLLSPSTSSEAIDVLGPAYTERDVSATLGSLLGEELSVEVIPEAAWQDALCETGFRPHIAASLAELYRADDRNLLAPRGDRVVRVHTTLVTTIASLLATHQAARP